mgnify:CR=1 FL=1
MTMDKQQLQVMFSSTSNDWATPQEFFDKLNWRFGPFDLDPCATAHTAKCLNFYTEMEDGLTKDWGDHCCFVNPPYGREIAKWIKKGYDEAQQKDTKVVMLIPGRLKFGDSSNSAPFPSAVVVFEGSSTRPQVFGAINR